jgi:AraC-like DNA-binding protein
VSDVRENNNDATARVSCWEWHGKDVASSRRLIHRGQSLVIEDSRRSAADPIGSGFADVPQIAIPYYGAFSWAVGPGYRIVDANSVLLIASDQAFVEAHPAAMIGHASAIFTPSDEFIDELASSESHARSVFAVVTRPVTDVTRLAVHRVIFDRHLAALAIEELVISILQSLFDDRKSVPERGGEAVVGRAKEALCAFGSRPISLEEVARIVGVSPIYLTQCFSRVEGIPLYRYQMRLRLSRALFELPRCGSLTELALDLGFSSHAHFTSTFRSAFGITPSVFRAEHRSRTYAAAA